GLGGAGGTGEQHRRTGVVRATDAKEIPMRSLTALLIAAPLTLGACADGMGDFEGIAGLGPRQTIGAGGGALAGGLLGSQIGSGGANAVATAAGALLGGFLGAEIGRQLDEADRREAAEAFGRAAEGPTGQTVVWRNPDSGNYGSVTPTGGIYAEGDRSCREYRSTATVGGQTETRTGVACRRPDGTWEVLA